jgi:hypothetical protein
MAQARLHIDWDPAPAMPGEWSPKLEARLGRVLKTSGAGRHGLTAEVEFLETPGRSGPDRGQLIFRSGETRSFALFVEDALKPGGVTVRDLNVRIRRANASMESIPPSVVLPEPAAPTPTPASPLPPIALGVPGLRQKFHVHADGTIELRMSDLASPGPDLEARPWKWPDVRYQVGLGEHPTMGPAASQGVPPQLEDGWLPILSTTRIEQGLRLSQAALASTLMGDPADLNTTNGCDPAMLLARLTVQNTHPEARTATLWLELNRTQPMRLSTDGSLILVAPSDGYARTNAVPIRAHINTHGKGDLDLAVLVPAAPGSHNPELAGSSAARQALRYRVTLPAGASHSIDLVIPGLELLTLEQVTTLKRLDYDRVHQGIRSYWKDQLEAGMTLSVPDPRANALFRTAMWRASTAIELDPASGHSLFPTDPAQPYGLRDLADVISMLQSRGEFRAARLLLDPILAQPGDPFGPPATGLRLTAASPASHPSLAQSALDHATVVRAAAKQFLLSRDPRWIRESADRLVRASDWMSRRRTAWRQVAAGSKGRQGNATPVTLAASTFDWNVGLLEAQQELAAALAAIQHPEAARMLREAEAFKADLRALVVESVATTPMRRGTDGRFIPQLGSSDSEEPQPPFGLGSSGVIEPTHPFSLWMIASYESRPSPRGVVPAAAARLFLQRGENERAFAAAAATWEHQLMAGLPFARGTPMAPASGGTSAVARECRLVQQLRDLVVLETAEGLDLLPGVPGSWMQEGGAVSVHRAATRWGLLDLDLHSKVASGFLSASIRLEASTKPQVVRLHVRHPAGQAPRSVVLDGQPFGAATFPSWIRLPSEATSWTLEIRY